MKKIIFVVMFMVAAFLQGTAQDYQTGIGIRGGVSSGLTVKHFVNPGHAVEGILSMRWGGLELTGLYEVPQTTFNTPRLNWYYGAGAHAGFWGENNHHWGDERTILFGLDGIIGMEYNFTEIPVNISLDWKPMLNIREDDTFWADGFGLSVRYIF
jgi:hypothetical protein